MRIALAVATVLILAGIGLTWRAYSSDLAAARARTATGSQIAQTRCGPIEYAIAGSGVPLLMIHGAGGGFDQTLAFGHGLLASGVQLVAPSRFGYLRTPAPAEPSAEAQADAHACLLDTLGIGRIAVLGASAGAPSAMQLCLRHPQRCDKLILLVPAAYTPAHAVQMPPPPGLQFVFEHVLSSDFGLWLMTRVGRDLLMRTMFGTPVADFDATTPEEQARVMGQLRAVQPVSQRAAGLAIDARICSSLPEYPLAQIAVPTLAISVANDLYGTYENARYSAQQIPGARFVGYPTGGHLFLGHDADVTREVAGFLGAAPATAQR